MDNNNNKKIKEQCRNLELTNGVILTDTSTSGKKIDWINYKKQSLAVSAAYGFYDLLVRYSEQIAGCGSYLVFLACPLNHMKKLIKAYFCRCRLCVMCQWRKSLVTFHQVLKLSHVHKERHASDVPLFLTLTVPNVSGEKLSHCLDIMFKAFKKLSERVLFKKAIRSWFRVLEITHNRERDDYHPHFHVLLMVPKAYFDKSRDLYISHEQWLQLWRDVTGIYDIKQVNVQTVKKRSQRNGLEATCAEVAKYATKPSDYLAKLPNGNFLANPKVVKILHEVLKGRRLMGYGGLFKILRKELKQTDVEKADLIMIEEDNLSDCVCSICQSIFIEELYQWVPGVNVYLN